MWVKAALDWLRGNREAVLIGVAALLVAGMLASIDRGAVRRTEARWQGAQAGAVTVATARKTVTEKAAAQAGARTEEKVNGELADLRAAYDDLRRRMRAQAGAGGVGRADLPGAAAAAGEPDAAARAELDALKAANADLAARLVAASEEGDRYRAQLIGWQSWWAEVEAAWALGEAVTVEKPPD